MKKKLEEYINIDHKFDKKTMSAIICLIIVISGVFGFLYEFIFYFFNDGMTRFHWQGANFLPWINIYAIGALIIYVLTYKKRKSPLKVFLIGMISCTLLEYFSGLGIYLILHTRYWDYNIEILNFGNIGGFICLRSVLSFGLSSLLLMYVVVPLLFSLAKHSNKKVFITISYLLCFIFLFDEVYNYLFSRMFNLPKASTIYKSIGWK